MEEFLLDFRHCREIYVQFSAHLGVPYFLYFVVKHEELLPWFAARFPGYTARVDDNEYDSDAMPRTKLIVSGESAVAFKLAYL